MTTDQVLTEMGYKTPSWKLYRQATEKKDRDDAIAGIAMLAGVVLFVCVFIGVAAIMGAI